VRIPMAVLADEANVSQEGKLNVLGIFDRIAAASFPVMHPKMVFAFRVEAEFADSGVTFPVVVSLEDADGATLFDAEGQIVAPAVAPGEFATANQVFTLVGVQFPAPGIYRFVVRLGEELPHVTPFLLSAEAPEVPVSQMN
jgi:hypothetical protein